MTTPTTTSLPQVDGMEVINDLSTQLGNALRDLAIQRAQIKILQAQVPAAPVQDTTTS